MKKILMSLTKFERILWLTSFTVVLLSFLLSPQKDYLTLIASLIGISALIFIAKGYIIGQVLIIIFAVFYGIISFIFRYYGEVITYLGMSAPMAILALVSWVKHPYKDTNEVEINAKLSKKQFLLMPVLTSLVTVIMYFVLKYLGTENIVFSTFSVATTFIAVYLTYLRNPFYALGYVANDVVLIVLWVLAVFENASYIPMIACFLMFLINDTYGFISWQKRSKKQSIQI